MTTDEAPQQRKVRENRLREAAKRQGLELRKSRQRDPRGTEFGMYYLLDPIKNQHRESTRDLDRIEALLQGEEE